MSRRRSLSVRSPRRPRCRNSSRCAPPRARVCLCVCVCARARVCGGVWGVRRRNASMVGGWVGVVPRVLMSSSSSSGWSGILILPDSGSFPRGNQAYVRTWWVEHIRGGRRRSASEALTAGGRCGNCVSHEPQESCGRVTHGCIRGHSRHAQARCDQWYHLILCMCTTLLICFILVMN